MTTTERISALELSVERLRLMINDPILHVHTLEWPQNGNDYWFIQSGSNAEKSQWINDWIDQGRKEMGNVFRTEQEVKNYRLRLQSMVHRWKPRWGDKYFTWSRDGFSEMYTSINSSSDWNTYYLGRCFKTEKEAIAHRDLYKAAWDALGEQE